QRDLRILYAAGQGEGVVPCLRGGEAPRAAFKPRARPQGEGEGEGGGKKRRNNDDPAGRLRVDSRGLFERGRARLRSLLHAKVQVSQRGGVQSLPSSREGVHERDPRLRCEAAAELLRDSPPD